MGGHYSYQYDMKFTDNPYIDLVVRDTKNMAINSVVKNERDALKHETLESRRNSDELIRYKAGLIKESDYLEEAYDELNNYYRQLNGQQPYPETAEVKEWITTHDYHGVISADEYDALMQELNATKYVPLQRYKDEGYITREANLTVFNNVGTGYYDPDTDTYYPDVVNKYQYVHEIQKDYNAEGAEGELARKILDWLDPDLDPADNQAWEIYRDVSEIGESSRRNVNILDIMKQDYTGPDFKYLYHLREKAIDPYTARTAPDFSLLYCPKPTLKFGATNTEFPIYYKFLRYFDRNREYTITTIYSDAYAIGSEHYEDVLIIFLLIQTMIDLIAEVQEYIINKDIFDSRTIRYLFESYGIEYYKEIPMNYQIKLIKNINEILKYKSTNRNIMDIKNLFGRDDIEIYTYWILKLKKKDRANFKYYTEEDVGTSFIYPGSTHLVTEDMVGLEKYYENYDLAFLRVPIEDQNADKYIENASLRRSYDTITREDPFWDGLSRDEIMSETERDNYHMRKTNEILTQDFSCERTKYICVDSAIDSTKYLYQTMYFMNMIFDAMTNSGDVLRATDALLLNIDSFISPNQVRLNDLLALMIALSYLYNGVEADNVASSMEANMTINGFDFSQDWSQVYDRIIDLFNTYANYVQPGTGEKVYLDDVLENPEQFFEYIEEGVKIRENAFLCGRYEPTTIDPGSRIFQDLKNHKIDDFFEGFYEISYLDGGIIKKKAYFKVHDDATAEGLWSKAHPTSVHNAVVAGKYDPENVFPIEDTTRFGHIVDISYHPYEFVRNTEADFMNAYHTNDEDPTAIQAIQTFEKLKEIYYTNVKLREHLVYMMKHAESKKEYDVYRILYESFMETQNDFTFFTIDEEDTPRVAETYYEFLSDRDEHLADILNTARNYSSIDDRRTYINQVCEYVVYALEAYFDSSEWVYLYNLIPSHNQEYVRDWIVKIINFFKSWKTQLIDTSSVFSIDDDSDSTGNRVHILDNLNKNGAHFFFEKCSVYDTPVLKSTFGFIDKVDLTERVKFNRKYSYYQTTELDFIYGIEDGEVRLIRYISNYNKIRLPEEIEGYPCTTIEATCFMEDVVIECEIPDCYRTII